MDRIKIIPYSDYFDQVVAIEDFNYKTVSVIKGTKGGLICKNSTINCFNCWIDEGSVVLDSKLENSFIFASKIEYSVINNSVISKSSIVDCNLNSARVGNSKCKELQAETAININILFSEISETVIKYCNYTLIQSSTVFKATIANSRVKIKYSEIIITRFETSCVIDYCTISACTLNNVHISKISLASAAYSNFTYVEKTLPRNQTLKNYGLEIYVRNFTTGVVLNQFFDFDKNIGFSYLYKKLLKTATTVIDFLKNQ